MWPKDPDAIHSPTGELGAAREELNRWYAAFPKMKVCISNHGVRWMKKACAAEIPSQLMRDYREVIAAPEGWIWQEAWIFRNLRHPFRVIHGMGYSGMNGHRTAALDGGISTAIGHLHSHAGIAYITTSGQSLWGMNTGSLIDVAAYAFKYGKDSRFKPCIGAAAVFDSGRTPIWVPYQ